MSSSSKYKVSIEQCCGYVRASVDGDNFIIDEYLEALAPIVQFCKEHGQTKLLVEENIRQDSDFFQMETFISQLPDFDISDFIVSVFIVNPKRQSLAHFGETVATSRGLNIRVFINREKAVDWISKR